jgi:hypothetical protein
MDGPDSLGWKLESGLPGLPSISRYQQSDNHGESQQDRRDIDFDCDVDFDTWTSLGFTLPWLAHNWPPGPVAMSVCVRKPGRSENGGGARQYLRLLPHG